MNLDCQLFFLSKKGISQAVTWTVWERMCNGAEDRQCLCLGWLMS